ncbi:MAG: EI24 domain-containing protein, partial [Betaproteobacteria bacterium]|nr:EI24 domain-containing protein [Betaproteobacteria bacterium]
MNPIIDALLRAFRDLFQRRVLWIMVWPILASALLWFILSVTFWSLFSEWIASISAVIGVQSWLEGMESKWVTLGIQVVMHLILLLPLVFVTALIMTALFAAPALVQLVGDRDYPKLKQEHGGNSVGSLINVLLAMPIFTAIWLITAPLWLAGAGAVLPFIASGYLNQRLFRYDALAEHATLEEMNAIFFVYRTSLWALGLLTGLVQFIPFVNVFAPVLTALAFIHFCLARLEQLRRSPREVLLKTV